MQIAVAQIKWISMVSYFVFFHASRLSSRACLLLPHISNQAYRILLFFLVFEHIQYIQPEIYFDGMKPQ